MIEHADIVSEGGRTSEPPGSTYYGSTHLRCTLEPRPDSIRELSVAALARLMLADPHARLRLVRLARREAVARAPGPIGVLEVELAVRPSDGPMTQRQAMVDVEIEVSAPLVDAASGQSFR